MIYLLSLCIRGYMRLVWRFLLIAGAVLAGNCSAQASFLTLKAIQNNTLYQLSSGSNSASQQFSNGAGQDIVSGQTGAAGGNLDRRGLIQFDVSPSAGIPAGSTINSVQVVLQWESSAPGVGPTTLFDLYRVTASWGAGTSVVIHSNPGNPGGANGGNSTVGDASWFWSDLTRVLPNPLGNAGTPWATAGGDFVGNGVILGSPSASHTVPVAGSAAQPVTWGSTAGLVADVQGWVDGTFSNDGWIIKEQTEVGSTIVAFDSLNGAVVPQLLIDFTPPAPVPEPASLALLAAAATGFAGYRWRRARVRQAAAPST